MPHDARVSLLFLRATAAASSPVREAHTAACLPQRGIGLVQAQVFPQDICTVRRDPWRRTSARGYQRPASGYDCQPKVLSSELADELALTQRENEVTFDRLQRQLQEKPARRTWPTDSLRGRLQPGQNVPFSQLVNGSSDEHRPEIPTLRIGSFRRSRQTPRGYPQPPSKSA